VQKQGPPPIARPPTPAAPAPRRFTSELAAAEKLFDNGDYAAAARGYQAVLNEDPRNTGATQGLQAVQKAIRAEIALKIAEPMKEARTRLEEGEYDAAIAAFNAVLKLDAKNSDALAGVAQAQKAKAAEAALLGKTKKPGA